MSTVAWDFDGVIHHYSRGWQDGTIYDEPVEGIFDLIKETMTQHAVFVHTTRDPETVARWLIRQNHELVTVTESSPLSGYLMTWRWDDGASTNRPMVHGYDVYHGTVKFWNDQDRIFVTNRKLPALAYVDDRAVRFTDVANARVSLIDYGILED